ncbi:hypothetical protein HY416_00390 [Candidatus Kaiserbacteria bacterium]|nr:hypothetical protein [Candidatus Kaiserbacteria bacterium]
MTYSIPLPKTIIGTLLVAAGLMPVWAHAATYAYVHQTGEVRTVVADAPMVAIMIAPGIDEHSGVLLLIDPSDTIVGDKVSGM